MQIKLYSFTKKDNSTARPTGAGTAFDCRLKAPSSVFDPVVTLTYGPNNWPDFNYAYIQDFHRYYFIDDIIAQGALFEIRMRCDLLATYKTEIGSSSLYVLRSASAYNGNLIDDYYPVKAGVTDQATFYQSPWISALQSDISIESDGCFVVGLISEIPTLGDLTYYPAYGSITYRAFTRANLQKMVNFLLDDNTFTNNGFSAADCSIALQKAVIDPLQFIKSCTYIPVPYSTITDAVETSNTTIWNFTMTGVASKAMQNSIPYKVISKTLTLTKHPLAATRGGYLNLEPYTKISVLAPPFGLLNLDTTLCQDENSVTAEFTIDLITGVATLIILIGSTSTHYLKTQVGVPIQLSQVITDVAGGITGAIGGFMAATIGALTMNPLAVFGGAAAMVGSAANAIRPNVSSVGSSGSFSDLRGLIGIYFEFRNPADEHVAEVGRPLCETRQINNLSGYIKALGDVPIAGTAGEQAAIKAMIEGGFFYE